MNHASNELTNYLQRIAQRSIKGEIPWSQPTPSTFQWVESGGENEFIITIQKATTPKLRGLRINEAATPDDTSYLFQVHDRGSKQTIVSLSSKERPEIFHPLGEIYFGAEKGMDVRASNVLKKLLGEI